MAAEEGHVANRVYLGQDGAIHLNGSAFYNDAETDISASLESVVGGVAEGYKIARGETALDGSNPTAVATGLTTIVAFVATLKGSSAPGLGTSALTYTTSSGTASVYAWKPTGAGDCTLIASTGTETFGWVAIGT